MFTWLDFHESWYIWTISYKGLVVDWPTKCSRGVSVEARIKLSVSFYKCDDTIISTISGVCTFSSAKTRFANPSPSLRETEPAIIPGAMNQVFPNTTQD